LEGAVAESFTEVGAVEDDVDFIEVFDSTDGLRVRVGLEPAGALGPFRALTFDAKDVADARRPRETGTVRSGEGGLDFSLRDASLLVDRVEFDLDAGAPLPALGVLIVRLFRRMVDALDATL